MKVFKTFIKTFKTFIKTFWGTTKKGKNKNLS